MPDTLPIDLTIVYTEDSAKELASSLGERYRAERVVSIAELPKTQHYGAIAFLIGKRSNLALVWQLVSSGMTTIPLLFDESDKNWQSMSVERALFLNRPCAAEYSKGCWEKSAMFLSAHGRSDTISLSDGKVCGFRASDQWSRFDLCCLPDQITPCCVKIGRCYRPDMQIISLPERVPNILFTNACESFSWGRDSAVASKWSFHNSIMSSGAVTFVGTPFVRNSSSHEIELAYRLFLSGLPLWQVVHIINYNGVRIGLDTCGYVIRGNPLVSISAPDRLQSLNLTPHQPTSTQIDISTEADVSQLSYSSELRPDSIMSKKDRFLYGIAPNLPGLKEVIWVAGKGRAEILLHNDIGAIKQGLQRELKAAVAWNLLERFVPLTAKESGSLKRWLDITSNAQTLNLPASIDSLVATKMHKRIKEASEARSSLEFAFVERLKRQAEKNRPRCPIDLSRSRLIFLNKTNSVSCPACDRKATLIYFENSWTTTRCPRCGVVSLNRGTELIHAISLPRTILVGDEVEVELEVDCEAVSCAIYRGDNEGISVEKRSINSWLMHVGQAVHPHFYYLRVYAVRGGIFDAAHRIFEISLRPS